MTDHELHAGLTLRAIREASGVSLSRMASLIHFHKSYLGYVETGKRPATVEIVKAYEKALGVTISEASAVRRRTLSAGLAVGLVSPSLLSEALRQGFTCSVGERASVDDWHQIADEYGQRFVTQGFDVVNRHLSGDLMHLRFALDGAHLNAVAARLAVIFGMTVACTGDPNGALRWYRTAQLLADESGDLATRVWVRGRSALTMGYEGADRGTVIALAGETVGLSRTPSIGLLEAQIALAQSYAIMGERRQALNNLSDAFDTFSGIGGAEGVTIYAMPAWRMAMSASLVYARLGDIPRAVEAQESSKVPADIIGFRSHIEMHRAILERSPKYALSIIEATPRERISLAVRNLALEAGVSRSSLA